MSMPLMACSTAPPRPCQKVLCRSFSRDAGRLVGALADQVRPQQRRPPASTSALLVMALPTPIRPSSVSDLDEGVEVLFGLVALRPAAVHGAAGQAGDADVDDLHVVRYLSSTEY